MCCGPPEETGKDSASTRSVVRRESGPILGGDRNRPVSAQLCPGYSVYGRVVDLRCSHWEAPVTAHRSEGVWRRKLIPMDVPSFGPTFTLAHLGGFTSAHHVTLISSESSHGRITGGSPTSQNTGVDRCLTACVRFVMELIARGPTARNSNRFPRPPFARRCWAWRFPRSGGVWQEQRVVIPVGRGIVLGGVDQVPRPPKKAP